MASTVPASTSGFQGPARGAKTAAAAKIAANIKYTQQIQQPTRTPTSENKPPKKKRKRETTETQGPQESESETEQTISSKSAIVLGIRSRKRQKTAKALKPYQNRGTSRAQFRKPTMSTAASSSPVGCTSNRARRLRKTALS